MLSHRDRATLVSVAIADSTQIHTHLLERAIQEDRSLNVLGTASSSEGLLGVAQRFPIDVAIISFNLDDQYGRGPQLLREIRARRPKIKGVILLESSQPQDVLDCFSAGAKGIFSGRETLESLCKCIRCVHEGQVWARSEDLQHALECLARIPLARVSNQQGLALLSRREREVVQYLALGMTNSEIAGSLGLSRHTIKNYLFRIFDKLGVSSRTELLYHAMGNIQPADDDAKGEQNPLSNLLQAAETDVISAQLQLGDQYRKSDGRAPDFVSAYMWYLLAEESAASLGKRAENSKKSLRREMSARDLEEAEDKAAQWFKSSKKKPAFADSGTAAGASLTLV